ncbi:MAG: septal ring lytic transglycosylase RlpA family protein [Coriobacteriia bacterium]|nr:septal ring lytic transglycosylase RlpA family protein [Coriobacteriia bacterium]
MALVIALAVCLAGLAAVPAVAAPSTAQTSADRARVDRAIAKFDAARKRSANVVARIQRASAELDRVMADQERIRATLESRVVEMYRSGDTGYISILFGAETIEDFTALWDVLARMSEQDAEALRSLEAARARAERSAKSLLQLQAEEARAVDATAREVAAARKTFATSAAALRAYEARVAAAKRAAAAKKKGPSQTLSGTGSWLTGVASHYSKNFTGRGASGARITPYSMMVAHKTLPFHTLLEIEYNGKRAVASVEDRGPFTKGRIFDLGPGVVRVLGFNGVHPVRYRIIGR